MMFEDGHHIAPIHDLTVTVVMDAFSLTILPEVCEPHPTHDLTPPKSTQCCPTPHRLHCCVSFTHRHALIHGYISMKFMIFFDTLFEFIIADPTLLQRIAKWHHHLYLFDQFLPCDNHLLQLPLITLINIQSIQVVDPVVLEKEQLLEIQQGFLLSTHHFLQFCLSLI